VNFEKYVTDKRKSMEQASGQPTWDEGVKDSTTALKTPSVKFAV
jgi:hypothetical protein